jgi:hypothetical protein
VICTIKTHQMQRSSVRILASGFFFFLEPILQYLSSSTYPPVPILQYLSSNAYPPLDFLIQVTYAIFQWTYTILQAVYTIFTGGMRCITDGILYITGDMHYNNSLNAEVVSSNPSVAIFFFSFSNLSSNIYPPIDFLNAGDIRYIYSGICTIF